MAAFGEQQTPIQTRGDSPIDSVAPQRNALEARAVFFEERLRAREGRIWRAIVDDDDFDERECLIDNRLEAVFDEILVTAGGNDNADDRGMDLHGSLADDQHSLSANLDRDGPPDLDQADVVGARLYRAEIDVD